MSVDGVDVDDVIGDVMDDEVCVEFCIVCSVWLYLGMVVSWVCMASVVVRGGGEFVFYIV